MANKAFIPAFKAKVGDWNYYICVMKYAQAAREISFAHELGGNTDLNDLIQRGISARTEDIVQYLLNSSHRFLGSLIVAAWGGDPHYLELSMEDSEGYLKGLDNGFGVLTLDGSQQYFALDGQHRLKAIKDAIKKNPALGNEDICVLMVAHHDTVQGRERTQRLFTNINRNAKTTTAAENIALDVDDAFAITTRELLMRDKFLSAPGRVRIFTRPPSGDGTFTLAAGSVPVGDKAAWSTISVLYDVLKSLAHDLPAEINDPSSRPSDDVLERTYDALAGRVDELLQACGKLRSKLEAAVDAKDVRAPKNDQGAGHPFMRPVVQKATVRAVETLIEQGALDWKTALKRLEELDWQLKAAPWRSVYNAENGRMITAKENVQLLEELLCVHLAPASKAEIARVRKAYKDVRHETYPVDAASLEKHL